MIERDAVRASASRLLERARAGSGAALLVIAEPGLGKTSVLSSVREQAAGFRIGSGIGDPMEQALPFGLIEQALAGVGYQQGFDPEGTAEQGGGARAVRLHQVLRWLQDQRASPLLLLLDDLHWSDGDSLAVFSFLCRRIAPLPVALLATLRPWPPEPERVCLDLAAQGCAVIERLAPLSREAAATVLAERLGQPPSPPVADRAWDLAGGNPLLLEQVAFAIGRGEELGGGGAPQVTRGLLLSRFAGLPPEGLACARAASVLGVHFRPDVACDLANLDDGGRGLALEALWRSRLVRDAGRGQLAFAHPLFRQALYEDLGALLRGAFHARAFHLLLAHGLDAEAAEHALPGGLAGRPAAVTLERLGRQALRAGAVATAMKALGAGVKLAGPDASPELVLDWASALVAGGHPVRARAVCERLLGDPDLPTGLRVRAQRRLADAIQGIGDPDRASVVSREATSLAEAADAPLAVSELVFSAGFHWITEGPRASLPLAARARERAAGGDAEARMVAGGAWGFFAVAAGDPRGLQPLAELVAAAERDPASYAFDGHLGWMSDIASLASALRATEECERAVELIGRALPVVEGSGAPNALASLLRGRAEALARLGRLQDALERMESDRQAASLTATTDALRRVTLATVLQLAGRLEESDAWAAPVESMNSGQHWLPLLKLWDMRGQRNLREGRPEEACGLYGRVEELAMRMGLGEPCWVPWAGHAASAYLAAGRLDDASRVVAWLEEAAARLPCRWPRIAAARGRAGMAALGGDHARAEAGYRAVLTLHEQVALPLEKVETLLEYGRFLVRSGSPARARPALAEAAELAGACGAGWLAAHAGRELAAAGGRRRRRSSGELLTPQERRVAELAAGGMSDSDIAGRLTLSARTIETHLRHVYAKLGISSRRQLIITVLADRPRQGDRHR
jgi:DNA-binding CsgD family transcriptional regulator/tetratricopeptide (TPR) repeat protein